MELLLLNRFLITTDTYNYIVREVKDNKEPIVIVEEREIKGNLAKIRKFDNFGSPTFFSTFSSALKKIKELMIKGSNVETIDELIKLLSDIDTKIERIERKFK